MVTIDFQTVFFNYFLTTLICLMVLVFLWWQNRNVFRGINYFLFDYLLLTLGLLLIFFRGSIPDFISIDISNLLSMTGVLLGLVGLEKLLGIRGKHYHNFVLLTCFFCIHTYFTLVKPNLAVRNLNTSITFLIFSLQYVGLIMMRLPRYIRNRSLSIGFIFIGFTIINLIRIADFFIEKHSTNDYFHSGAFQIWVIISYQILFVLFAFSLVLLMNKQLLSDNEWQKEKFLKAFQASPFAMLLTRMSDGKILEANNGFQNLTGYLNTEVMNKTTIDLDLWEDVTFRDMYVNALTLKGSVRDMEFNFRKKNGELFMGLISSEMLTIDQEWFAISVIHNITERKRAETQLKQYASELKLANDTQNKLFSILGHDLRSPFTSIIGFSELIRDEVDFIDKEIIRTYANTVHTSALQTQNLFQNLLEWAKLQQGSFGFYPESVNVAVVVCELKELLQGSALKKKILISDIIEESLTVKADVNMLKTIIRNLVSNSIKYTPVGGSVVIVAKTESEEIIISVTDNGIGMEAQTLSTLFKPGIESQPGTENEKGTGLGLLLCHEFVEIHKGRIWAESIPGKGSTIHFALPNFAVI